MGRIDIVVFIGKSKEIFGQVKGEPAVEASVIETLVNSYVAALADPSAPRKFTGYYDEQDDPVKIEWSAYDENNPIVQIPDESANDSADEQGFQGMPSMVSVEMSQVPEALRDILLR